MCHSNKLHLRSNLLEASALLSSARPRYGTSMLERYERCGIERPLRRVPARPTLGIGLIGDGVTVPSEREMMRR